MKHLQKIKTIIKRHNMPYDLIFFCDETYEKIKNSGHYQILDSLLYLEHLKLIRKNPNNTYSLNEITKEQLGEMA